MSGECDDDTDLARTIATAPALCRPAATLLWSRARAGGDLNDMVRARFAADGFTELDYARRDTRAAGDPPLSGPALGHPRAEARRRHLCVIKSLGNCLSCQSGPVNLHGYPAMRVYECPLWTDHNNTRTARLAVR